VRTLVLAVLLISLMACRKAESSAQVSGPPETVTYAKELDVHLDHMTKKPSGLYVLDIQEGTGPGIAAGQTAQVHYTGWLVDGKQFDSSLGGSPLEFAVGQAQVIAGWDEGVEGMKKGGKRRLVVPPELGYGAEGYPGAIPKNATLVFDVELVGIR
jgi:FKBP-type peptidyl-prolyl cis-trans isomerase FkpA